MSSVTNKYQAWCDAYAEEHGSKVYGRCREAVAALCEAFPELTEVRGHVDCPPPWNRRGHTWATHEDTIYDPTKTQFPAIFGYDAWTPGEEVRWGVCMDCGEEIWMPLHDLDEKPDDPPHAPFCSTRCNASYAAYMNGGPL